MFFQISLLAAAAIAAATVQAPQTAPQGAASKAASAPKPISRSDVIKSLDARFSGIDKNKDGSLDKMELQSLQATGLARAAVVQQQRLEAQFKKLDTDKNNQLSLAEFKAVAAPPTASQSVDKMLSDLDSNKDGKVTANEYREKPLAQFDKADTNKDGVVSPAENRAARRR